MRYKLWHDLVLFWSYQLGGGSEPNVYFWASLGQKKGCLLWVYGGTPRFIKSGYLFDKSRELISSLDPTSWVPLWLVPQMSNSVIDMGVRWGVSDPGNRPRTTTCSNPLLRRSNSKQHRCQINKSTIVYKIVEIEILARRAPSLFKHLISCILDTIATTLRCFDRPEKPAKHCRFRVLSFSIYLYCKFETLNFNPDA